MYIHTLIIAILHDRELESLKPFHRLHTYICMYIYVYTAYMYICK